jgi:hypothetical protein
MVSFGGYGEDIVEQATWASPPDFDMIQMAYKGHPIVLELQLSDKDIII